MIVPNAHILRNHAALTGADPKLNVPVTAICVSKRPWYLDRVAAMLKAQTHKDLHIIYVAHGEGHDRAQILRAFAGVRELTVLEAPDPASPLGECLNLGLDHCTTDLVTKIDDDDFYGPNYITGALAAFLYSGHPNVGIVGVERAYCYSEELDAFALRYGRSHENSLRTRVFGSTIFWSRKALQDQRFISANTGEDTAFFQAATDRGVQIFSTDPCDYVAIRYAHTGAHTWSVDARQFLKPATILGPGLRLDWAYSSRELPVATPIPPPQGTEPLPDEPGFVARLQGLIAEERADPERLSYRSLLMSKAHCKIAVPRLVPEMYAPRTYQTFRNIADFVAPEAGKFVLKPASGSHSYGVYCLERLGGDRLRDLTTGREYTLPELKAQYRADFDGSQGKMTLGCFTEEYIRPEPGYSRPHDYKAYCFGPHVALIMQKAFVTPNRKDWRFKFWSPDWQDLGAIKYPDRLDPSLPAPKLGARAVELISKLSGQIARPFVRIDVYITGSEIVFSEITPDPNGGKDYFNAAWNRRLGQIWAEHGPATRQVDHSPFMGTR